MVILCDRNGRSGHILHIFLYIKFTLEWPTVDVRKGVCRNFFEIFHI